MIPSSRPGRSVIPLLVLLAVVAAAPVCRAATPFPAAATGDIWFQVDQAGFLGDGNQAVEEYYVRITNDQLEFESGSEGDSLSGQVFISLRFRDADENDLGEAGRRFGFRVFGPEIAASSDYAQLLVFREPLDPRTRFVEVTVEDLNARKRGLLYMFTGKRKNGEAYAALTPPPFLGHEFGISDIQFAWEVRKEEGGNFEKQGLNVIPNPSRSYGLLQPRLTAYYEVYDHRTPEPADHTYVVHHELVGPSGDVVTASPDTVTTSGGEWVKVTTFDLSKLATGKHILRAVVVHPATGDSAVSARAFSVLWKNQFWEMTEQDLLDEARVLFREDEYDRFRNMTAGDRAQYVDQFWADQDPTPISARNELREEFLRRVAYANRYFSDQKKGMLTDRGRIYIRFGEPDEVQREVLPTQRESQLGGQVRDLTEENISGSMLTNKDVVDTRPYEIWDYTRQGEPLFPERERTTSVTGLRFVFIDETGTGHYVLRYSSDFIGY